MNGDLISRSKLLAALDHARTHGIGVREAVKSVPTEDAEIVRHGRWTEIDASYWRWRHDGAHEVFRKKFRHDECGKICANREPYCPRCGAKMDAEKEADNG